MSEPELTMEFARRDDCLDRMVPSDLRLLIGERDRLADRLAKIERQVIYRTEDMPDDVRLWQKYEKYGQMKCAYFYPCGWPMVWGSATAPDLRPDLSGPVTLPIIDAPDAGREDR